MLTRVGTVETNAPGKLQGNKIAEILGYLIDKRIIISMHIVGTSFERLTCVTQMSQNPQPFFVVDLPDNFKAEAQSSSELILRFNFNGPDRLEYIFTTKGGRINGRELHLPFPDHMERLQRRRNFRMETPLGTKMFLKLDKIHAVLGLINISLGGAYGTLLKPSENGRSSSLLEVGQRILNVGILFPADDENEEQIVIIKRTEVRRIEHDQDRKIYKYAFEFTDVAPDELKKLTQLIYRIQRQFLQRR
ncbi:MAG: PilZ domain-containing protein [Desulfobacteraceae bacterium]|nr:PilZ domain-containing protein [Desulfobacteraceae bacterium]